MHTVQPPNKHFTLRLSKPIHPPFHAALETLHNVFLGQTRKFMYSQPSRGLRKRLICSRQTLESARLGICPCVEQFKMQRAHVQWYLRQQFRLL